jgi:hypothetical protein
LYGIKVQLAFKEKEIEVKDQQIASLYAEVDALRTGEKGEVVRKNSKSAEDDSKTVEDSTERVIKRIKSRTEGLLSPLVQEVNKSCQAYLIIKKIRELEEEKREETKIISKLQEQLVVGRLRNKVFF